MELNERVQADGTVETALDPAEAEAVLAALKEQGYKSVAIALMHAYKFPAHEAEIARIARSLDFEQVSVSHEVSPLIKLVGRGDTTVVDAYLSPVLRRYVAQVANELDVERTGARVMFMMSSGGLTAADLFQGKDAILSGPAGGVVGLARTGETAGFPKVIGFDMGGTSTDVAHFDGEYERAFETEVAGVRVRAPMMLIHTVAAGGGSVLHYDAGRFRVGPDSAGANPGPACYRNGGPLAVTDANVMLGKLLPEFFPAIFGPEQNQPLDVERVRERFTALAAEIGDGRSPEAVADGFIRIAVANMVEAIKKISVQRGYDVTRYALNCFGGAGGQHACLVADALGMKNILLHPMSGLLSAYGMGTADIRATRQKALGVALDPAAPSALKELGEELAQECVAELTIQGIEADAVERHLRAHVRYAGTDTVLSVEATFLPRTMPTVFAPSSSRPISAVSASLRKTRLSLSMLWKSKPLAVAQAKPKAPNRSTAIWKPRLPSGPAFLAGRVARCGRCLARTDAAWPDRHRSGNHHREEPDHRYRRWLAGAPDCP